MLELLSKNPLSLNDIELAINISLKYQTNDDWCAVYNRHFPDTPVAEPKLGFEKYYQKRLLIQYNLDFKDTKKFFVLLYISAIENNGEYLEYLNDKNNAIFSTVKMEDLLDFTSADEKTVFQLAKEGEQKEGNHSHQSWLKTYSKICCDHINATFDNNESEKNTSRSKRQFKNHKTVVKDKISARDFALLQVQIPCGTETINLKDPETLLEFIKNKYSIESIIFSDRADLFSLFFTKEFIAIARASNHQSEKLSYWTVFIKIAIVCKSEKIIRAFLALNIDIVSFNTKHPTDSFIVWLIYRNRFNLFKEAIDKFPKFIEKKYSHLSLKVPTNQVFGVMLAGFCKSQIKEKGKIKIPISEPDIFPYNDYEVFYKYILKLNPTWSNVIFYDELAKKMVHALSATVLSTSFEGRIEFAKLLLSHDANPNFISNQVEAPIIHYLKIGDKEMVSLFLNHEPTIDKTLNLVINGLRFLPYIATECPDFTDDDHFHIFQLAFSNVKLENMDIEKLTALRDDLIYILARSNNKKIIECLLNTRILKFSNHEFLVKFLKPHIKYIIKNDKAIFISDKYPEIKNAFMECLKKSDCEALHNMIASNRLNFVNEIIPLFVNDPTILTKPRKDHFLETALNYQYFNIAEILIKHGSKLNDINVNKLKNFKDANVRNFMKANDFIEEKKPSIKSQITNQTNDSVQSKNQPADNKASTLLSWHKFIYCALGYASNINIQVVDNKFSVTLSGLYLDFKNAKNEKYSLRWKIETADFRNILMKINQHLLPLYQKTDKKNYKMQDSLKSINSSIEFTFIPPENIEAPSADQLNLTLLGHLKKNCKEIQNVSTNTKSSHALINAAMQKYQESNKEVFFTKISNDNNFINDYLSIIHEICINTFDQLDLRKYVADKEFLSTNKEASFNFSQNENSFHLNDKLFGFNDILTVIINRINGFYNKTVCRMTINNHNTTLFFSTELIANKQLEDDLSELKKFDLPEPIKCDFDKAVVLPHTVPSEPQLESTRSYDHVSQEPWILSIMRTISDLDTDQHHLVKSHYDMFTADYHDKTLDKSTARNIGFVHFIRILECIAINADEGEKPFLRNLRNLLRHLYRKIDDEIFEGSIMPMMNIIYKINATPLKSIGAYVLKEEYAELSDQLKKLIEPYFPLLTMSSKDMKLNMQAQATGVFDLIQAIITFYLTNSPVKKIAILSYLCILAEDKTNAQYLPKNFFKFARHVYRELGHNMVNDYKKLEERLYKEFEHYCENNEKEWSYLLSEASNQNSSSISYKI